MRLMKMGGAPRDRRLDRRKVAIAAAAALFLSAASARANVVDFVLTQSASSVKNTVKLIGPVFAPFGGSVTASPQGPLGDQASLFGHIYVDITPGSIQFLPGSYITFQGLGSGNYAPFDPVISDPPGPPPVGTTPNADFGYAFPFAPLNLSAVLYNLRWDFTAPPQSGLPMGVPSTPIGLAGQNFDMGGQAMSFTDGRQAFVSGLGNDSSNNIGFPSLYGTGGSDIGTWDGTTLTIPIHSKIQFNVTSASGGIDEQVLVTGQMVATPFVPEPSSMTLLGFGVVGLLSYAWRARKRKAIAA
jgi:hypothetical protein